MKILDHLCKLECIRAIYFFCKKWCIGGAWGLIEHVKFSIIWVRQRDVGLTLISFTYHTHGRNKMETVNGMEIKMETVIGLEKRKVLEVLPNGANALAVFRGQDVGVVLATWREEYVTWIFYRGDLGTTTHGNYFMFTAFTTGCLAEREAEAFEDAKADFLKRVTKYI